MAEFEIPVLPSKTRVNIVIDLETSKPKIDYECVDCGFQTKNVNLMLVHQRDHKGREFWEKPIFRSLSTICHLASGIGFIFLGGSRSVVFSFDTNTIIPSILFFILGVFTVIDVAIDLFARREKSG